ncbi:hypothetical protein T484DRAFT_2556328 [Baffinella frigidus]|nr:hypothetical protein T484DRAFT_2556328 [Cryptophyta sp. CCMP2293]
MDMDDRRRRLYAEADTFAYDRYYSASGDGRAPPSFLTSRNLVQASSGSAPPMATYNFAQDLYQPPPSMRDSMNRHLPQAMGGAPGAAAHGVDAGRAWYPPAPPQPRTYSSQPTGGAPGGMWQAARSPRGGGQGFQRVPSAPQVGVRNAPQVGVHSGPRILEEGGGGAGVGGQADAGALNLGKGDEEGPSQEVGPRAESGGHGWDLVRLARGLVRSLSPDRRGARRPEGAQATGVLASAAKRFQRVCLNAEGRKSIGEQVSSAAHRLVRRGRAP